MAIINKAIGLSSVAAAAIATASSSSSYAALPSFLSCSASQPSPQRARTQLRTSTSAPVSQTLRFSSTAAMAIGSTVAADHFLKKDNQTQNGALPEVVTEFMVDMKCEGCASSVRRSLEPLEGVKRVDVDLQNQVVRVQGTAALKTLNEALEQAGRRSRLIGQGASDYIYNAAIVAEFKGPEIFGVVRIVQVSMELARIEASFSGLSKGQHGWSINEYGDLTRGAASTGNIYNMPATGTKPSKPIGDLGVLEVDDDGNVEYSGSIPMLKVSDLPGRALVIYESEDMSKPGIAAAVVARSAGVGENYKKLCTCDGTVIWDSTNSDFVKVESKL